MLWREPYTTRTVEADWPPLRLLNAKGEPLPVAPDFAVIGSFRARAMQQREVWRKLFEAELNLPFHLVLVGHEPGSSEAKLWLGAMPPSVASSAAFLLEESHRWQELLAPEHEDQAFAALIKDGRADLVMVGPPTEEAWETFLQRGSSASR